MHARRRGRRYKTNTHRNTISMTMRSQSFTENTRSQITIDERTIVNIVPEPTVNTRRGLRPIADHTNIGRPKTAAKTSYILEVTSANLKIQKYSR